MTSLYVSSTAPFLKEFHLEETSRFPNVEFLETDDPTVYFDRRETGPIPFISPLQAYLELSKAGKREQEAAEPLRADQLKRLIRTTSLGHVGAFEEHRSRIEQRRVD